MRTLDGRLRLSASDLMRSKGCRDATTLDLRIMEIGEIVPASDKDEAVLLQQQGNAHELAFLEELRASDRSIVEIPKDGLTFETSVKLTREAMLAGPDVIFEGHCSAVHGAAIRISWNASITRPHSAHGSTRSSTRS